MDKEQIIEFAKLNMHRRDYKRIMDSLYPTGWTYMDLAEYIAMKRHGKNLAELSTSSSDSIQPLPPAVDIITPESSPDIDLNPPEVERRLQEYLSVYEAETPNDVSVLRRLCASDIVLERLNERWINLSTHNGSPTEIKALVESITKISAENRQLQMHLKIDKSSRGEGEDAGKKLMDYIQAAKKIMHQQGFPIICAACAKSESKTVNLYGFIVWHFEQDVDWSFTFTCPRCKATMTYTKDNAKDVRTIAKW